MQEACTEDLRLYPLTDVTDFLDLVNSRKKEAADRIKGIFLARSDSLSKTSAKSSTISTLACTTTRLT